MSPFFRFLLLALMALFLADVCLGQTTERVSVNSQGVGGDESSSYPSISESGRYVAFSSRASNFVAANLNSAGDVFVHDRQTGMIERVSKDSFGVEGDYGSGNPYISADGRYVVFESHATNLVAGDLNLEQDVFIHDRQTGTTKRVSVSSQGVEGDDFSWMAAISSDGRYVVFASHASNLVAGDTNGDADIFVHDRQTSMTERLSVGLQGAEANNLSVSPSISADGRYVAFQSSASNLVVGDSNGAHDIFIYDRQTNVTERVSVNSQGVEGNNTSDTPSISGNGRWVTFRSLADNLDPLDMNSNNDIFVRDRLTNETKRVSVDYRGQGGGRACASPLISANGGYVVFQSYSNNLVPEDLNDVADIFVHDMQSGITERISVNSSGIEANYSSHHPSISADGRYVAFYSSADNLVLGDTGMKVDVFVRDRWNGLGSDFIYLTGPSTAPVGTSLTLLWFTARPDSQYWLAYSLNKNGSVVGGHAIDLGSPLSVLATGVNSVSGTSFYHSPPVPSSLAGVTVFAELLARDVGGVLYDSKALAITFF